MDNLKKIISIILLCFFSLNSNASDITKECISNKTYTSGEICKHNTHLFLAKHWVNGFNPSEEVWFKISIVNAADWVMEQSYNFGDVVLFDNLYFVATQWNINNCPTNTVNCPDTATRYNSWEGFDYEASLGEAKLSFKTVYDHDEAMPFSEVPILIDNVYVGTTNNEGILDAIYELPQGSKTVKVSYKGKVLDALIEPEQSYRYVLNLKESEIYYEDSNLIGVPTYLNNNDELNVHFEGSNGEVLLSQYLEQVLLIKLLPNIEQEIDITKYFQVNSNYIKIKDISSFYTALSKLGNGQYEICITTSNDYEQYPSSCVKFFFPTGKMDIQLVLPQNLEQTILFEDLSVEIASMATDTLLKIKPNSEGKISIAQAELGHWKIHSKLVNTSGEVYHTLAQFELKSDMAIRLNYLHYNQNPTPSDYYEISHSAGMAQPENVYSNSAKHSKDLKNIEDSVHNTLVDSFLKAAGDKNNEPIMMAKSKKVKIIGASTKYQIWDKEYEFTVPEGINSLQLNYTVASNMWQYFGHDVCTGQSNNTWEISLQNNDGSIFYARTRDVYSQLHIEPILVPNPDGPSQSYTSEIFDISKLGANDRTFRLKVDTKGPYSYCRWSMILSAVIYPKLKVIKAKSNLTDAGVKYPESVFSIPKLAKKNTFHRTYDLTISKDPNVELTTIDVYLAPSASVIQPVLIGSYAFGASFIEDLGGDKYRVPVTFKKSEISHAFDDAPFNNFKYQFIVKGIYNNQEVQSEINSKNNLALWHMPSKINRFGWLRDRGGDDWSSRATYLWLDKNSSLITKVNDISGEHGRDIGHSTHKYGTDIDILQFTQLHNKSGLANYKRLRSSVIKFFDKNLSASDAQKELEKVKGWVSNQRAGLDALSNDSSVRKLYSGYGRSKGILPNGWLFKLMTNGSIKIGNKVLDSNLGSWNPSSKMKFNHVHNDHDHITLDRKALATSP